MLDTRDCVIDCHKGNARYARIAQSEREGQSKSRL
jgi:hypothetical protein